MIIFGRDGELFAFASASDAASGLESIDVAAGEYVAAYAIDGRALHMAAAEKRRVMVTHGPVDRPDLIVRLRAAQDRLGFAANPEQPDLVGAELLETQRRGTWPRWPRWLNRRIHHAGTPGGDVHNKYPLLPC